MKRVISVSLSLLLIFINILIIPVSANDVKLDSENAILVDMQNSMVLHEKNGTASIQPAGFTKIVTALVVLENCSDLEQVISAPAETIAACDFSFGNMGVLGGEELSARALLEGMLLYDAAEAAEILAGFTFGDYDKFISAMNAVATAAGAENTVFKNAGGYYDEHQHTTVADIAKIAQYAMNNTAFAQIVKKDIIEIPPTNKYRETRYLSNTNMFVGRARSVDFYSERVSGVKTSYMKDHGYGICISFENSKGKFMCVTAGGTNANAAHTDAQTLREHTTTGFTNVQIASKGDIIEEVSVPNGNISHVLLKTAEELSVRLPVGYNESDIQKWTEKIANLKAPIQKGQILGTLNIAYNGETVGSVNLIAYDSVEYSIGKSVSLFIGKVVTSPLFYLPILAVIMAFAVLVLKAYHERKHKNK